MSTLVVRPLGDADEAAASAAHAELALDHFDFLPQRRDDEPWAAYVRRVRGWAHGRDLPPGWVATTFLVGTQHGEIVGRVSIRHGLDFFHAEYGGHIGYAVRPACRRQGHATALLTHGLAVARQIGLDRVLVTCDEGNVGSAAVIEGCGGRFERLAYFENDSPPKRRYWIVLL